MTSTLSTLLLAGAALAQDAAEPENRVIPSNLSATSLGTQVVAVPALGAADADLLLGQRTRWTFGEVDEGFNRLWVDSRFTIDPFRDVVLERTRVTRLGVELDRGDWTIDLGRAPVWNGGPRLVDGVQGRARLGQVEVGGWGGLAPDLFTTLPRFRPALGPMIAWQRSQVQATLVGEVALSPNFEVDRVASLATGRFTRDRWLDLSARLDVDWASPGGGPHLADGQMLAIWRPSEPWRFDVLYNAFSSLRYLQTEPLDPSVQRFDQRILDLGVQLGVAQDFLDPTLNHLVGGTIRWADPPGLGAALRAQVDGRYRYHPNPLNRFARVHGQVGVSEIPVGGALDVALDAAAYEVNRGIQGDCGVMVIWEPTEDRSWAIDTSGRALLAPAVYDGLGWYSDLFFDTVLSRTWLIAAGATATREPDPEFDDLALAGFVRVTASVR